MDIVRLLPDSVANQIAAGEVIQRPASCLKELVENSLDAGATFVQIIVRDAGRTLLQVVDNGQGMSETDARMAFERHATSKIRDAADLFELRTMGFRGEALASICAVANVEMQTRREEDELGTLIEISGSQVQRQEPVQCAKGTNMRVKNLFFNVPARRRFLKTDQTEMRNILQEFFRIVLVNPDVRFTLTHNDEILYDLKAGTDKQRIEAVFGKSARNLYAKQLVDIVSDNELVRIHGFIGTPESANRNPQQYFFVNRRFMRHPYFHKAVMTAYQGLLHNDCNPSYFIYFDINPETIDVNIHPTKTEIKFADEQLIFPILLATVREALGKFNVLPSIDFDTSGKVEMPLPKHDTVIPVAADFLKRNPAYNPFHSSPSDTNRDWHKPAVDSRWQSLYQPANSQSVTAFSDVDTNSILPEAIPEALFEHDFQEQMSASPYQMAGKYIVQPLQQGLLLIDQHRAHALLLYDQCRKRLQEHNGEVQQLLFPEIWDVGMEDQPLIESNKNYFRDLGFILSPLTRGSYNVTGVPVLLGSQNALLALQQLLDSLREMGDTARDERERHIAWTMANSAAIPYGKSLTEDEINNLVTRFLQLENVRLTPSGKKAAVLLTEETVSRLFT